MQFISNLYLSRTIIPHWDEIILFNEKYEHIITENTVMLFELVDFMGSIRPSISEDNWHRIAWAFVKPIGSNGITNTGKQIRLQLYKPGINPKSSHKNLPVVGKHINIIIQQ